MTTTKDVAAKREALTKLVPIVGAEHESQLKRLPVKTLEAILTKVEGKLAAGQENLASCGAGTGDC